VLAVCYPFAAGTAYDPTTTFEFMVTIIRKKTPKSRLRAAVKRAKAIPQQGFDALKHLGKWKLDEDALATQKRLRDEWE
jgi:hypothetical protein